MSSTANGSAIGPQPARSETWRSLGLLLMLALLTRAWIFGDPVVNIDEQFYLMVGERMRDGALPYVDIWDRKPIGLFLIYELACRLFADAALGYQLLALLSVVVTAVALFAMLRRLVPFWPALAAAATYEAWLLVFGGIGGQTPVFYNLPMMLAAATLLGLVADPGAESLARKGCAIMLLTGIAMQIKYTALFEGIYFGLTLLWLAQRRGCALVRLAALAVTWIACALAPTAMAAGVYVLNGHGPAFFQANFLSVFGNDTPMLEALGRLAALTFGISPLLFCTAVVWRGRHTRPAGVRLQVNWLLGWAAASYLGLLAYGVWNDHYVLPLLLPFSALAGVAIAAVGWPRRLAAVVIGLGLIGGGVRAAVDVGINGDRDQVRQLSALVRHDLGDGCLYVNEDLSILYATVPGCLPTRFVFPQHLALGSYRHALGIDQLGELRRVLDGHPTVIVVSTTPDPYTAPENRKMLETALRQHYRRAAEADVGETRYAVYTLVDRR